MMMTTPPLPPPFTTTSNGTIVFASSSSAANSAAGGIDKYKCDCGLTFTRSQEKASHCKHCKVHNLHKAEQKVAMGLDVMPNTDGGGVTIDYALRKPTTPPSRYIEEPYTVRQKSPSLGSLRPNNNSNGLQQQHAPSHHTPNSNNTIRRSSVGATSSGSTSGTESPTGTSSSASAAQSVIITASAAAGGRHLSMRSPSPVDVLVTSGLSPQFTSLSINTLYSPSIATQYVQQQQQQAEAWRLFGSHTPPMLPQLSADMLDAASFARALSLGKYKNIVVVMGEQVGAASGNLPCASPDLSSSRPISTHEYLSLKYFSSHQHPLLHLCRDLFLGHYHPTTAHFFLRLLAEKGMLMRCYTLNVDDMERAVGVPDAQIQHLRGNIRSARCSLCLSPCPIDVFTKGAFLGETTRCSCGGIIRPNIVFSDELLLPGVAQNIEQDLPRADLVIFIGATFRDPFTSLISTSRAIGPNVPRLYLNSRQMKIGSPRSAPSPSSSPATPTTPPPSSAPPVMIYTGRDLELVGDHSYESTKLICHAGWTSDFSSLLASYKEHCKANMIPLPPQFSPVYTTGTNVCTRAENGTGQRIGTYNGVVEEAIETAFRPFLYKVSVEGRSVLVTSDCLAHVNSTGSAIMRSAAATVADSKSTSPAPPLSPVTISTTRPRAVMPTHPPVPSNMTLIPPLEPLQLPPSADQSSHPSGAISEQQPEESKQQQEEQQQTQPMTIDYILGGTQQQPPSAVTTQQVTETTTPQQEQQPSATN